jgi:hypothetical protein
VGGSGNGADATGPACRAADSKNPPEAKYPVPDTGASTDPGKPTVLEDARYIILGRQVKKKKRMNARKPIPIAICRTKSRARSLARNSVRQIQ